MYNVVLKRRWDWSKIGYGFVIFKGIIAHAPQYRFSHMACETDQKTTKNQHNRNYVGIWWSKIRVKDRWVGVRAGVQTSEREQWCDTHSRSSRMACSTASRRTFSSAALPPHSLVRAGVVTKEADHRAGVHQWNVVVFEALPRRFFNHLFSNVKIVLLQIIILDKVFSPFLLWKQAHISESFYHHMPWIN